MTDDADINLDSEWTDLPPVPGPAGGANAPEGSQPAEPVVVIQYRNRGMSPVLLFPLTLLASLALFIGYHHFFVEPITSRAEALAQPTAAPPARPMVNPDEALARVAAAMPAELQSIPMPLTLESQPLPSGFFLPPTIGADPKVAERAETDSVANRDEVTPAASAEPPADPAPPPAPATPIVGAEPEGPAPISIASAAPDRARSFPFQPEPAAADPEPVVDPPPPTREELMERIRQEGLLKQAREEEIERRKSEARGAVEAEALERVENERVEFRQALQDIVASGGQDAGEAIDDLCNRFGRGYNEDVKNRAYGSLAHYKGKLSREGEVQMLRAIGVPEAGILDYLANRLHRSMKSRNGPRDPGEVRLFAARQLLRIKVDPSAVPAPAPATSTDRKPASVRRTTNVRRP
ncbi:hypothetical protein [Paludisphaera soli]|uniref:hypothetical protein n=1 Tax=Paludisphaera soli TaxID=2712865 RepID=UPI0013ED08FD|nr:hypothetical protein [Paludisphaera soli]